jgi:heme a synthase
MRVLSTRGIYVANLVVQSGIIVTGALVRISGSGLGCPTWPQCVEGSYTPTARQEEAFHKYIEFGNRLLTFVVAAVAIATIIAMILDTRRRRRSGLSARKGLIILSVVPLLGTIIQAVLGGVTVLTGLHPVTVSAHFLLSMLLVAASVALVARTRDPGDYPIRYLAPKAVRILAWALVAATALVVFLGVIVTGSGPHSGDAEVEARFSFDPRTVAWIHADTVFLFLGLLCGMIVALFLFHSTGRMRRRVILVTAIAIAQASVGYIQYFAGLPEVLVFLHVIGAVLVWIAVLFVPFSMRTRGIPITVETDPHRSTGITTLSR